MDWFENGWGLSLIVFDTSAVAQDLDAIMREIVIY